MRRILPV